MIIGSPIHSGWDAPDGVIFSRALKDSVLFFHLEEQQILHHSVLQPFLNQLAAALRRHPLIEDPGFPRLQNIHNGLSLTKTDAACPTQKDWNLHFLYLFLNGLINLTRTR